MVRDRDQHTVVCNDIGNLDHHGATHSLYSFKSVSGELSKQDSSLGSCLWGDSSRETVGDRCFADYPFLWWSASQVSKQ